MRVPFVDLKAQYESIRDEIDAEIHAVIDSTAFVGGPFVERFEEEFADYCGAAHCIGVGNGTDAVFIALRCLGIGPGDEVIVPANSFVATSEAVTLAGAQVVFCDVDPRTCTIDCDALESLVTERTKAVIPVHLYGLPADLPRIAAIAAQHNLKVVGDAAQAHGATVDGKPIAALGTATCFSFYPGKNLGAYGDGGAIVTDDPELAQRIRMFRNHGRKSKYDHEIEAVNSRLDAMQAAVLSVKLKHLETWTEQRRAHAARYDELLAGVSGITTPCVPDGYRHVYHLYVIQTDRRDELREHLTSRGIASGVHYPITLPNLTAYARLGHDPRDFPVASRLQDRILSLPMFAELTGEQIAVVCGAIEG